MQLKTFVNFVVLVQFVKVLTTKISLEYGSVIVDGRVIILDSIGIMDVASLSPARQYLSNNSFPNCRINIVASINSHHFVAL